MADFSPSINTGRFSDSSFFQQINQARSRQQGGRITINDLVNERLDRSGGTPAAESPSTDESDSTESTDETSVGDGRVVETGRDRDVRAEGDSFIALSSGESQRFTQSVSLEVSEDGEVRDSLTGRQLQQTVETSEDNVETEGIELSEQQRTSEAQETSEASIDGNLSDSIARGNSVQFEGEFTNAEGGTETVGFRATRTGDNQFEITAQDPTNGDDALRATVSFDAEGNVENTEVDANDSGFEGLSFESGTGGEVQVSADSLDLSNVTFGQGEGETTVGANDENGRSSGELTGLTLSESGELQGDFSNGETQSFGQVATAQFEDTSGLTEIDNGQFLSNGLSGEADFSAGASLSSGELETQDSSNTQAIADEVLGGEEGPDAFGGQTRSQLLGAVFDFSA